MIYTRDFFEDKGWRFGYYNNGILKFEKGDVTKDDGMCAFIHANILSHNIKITTSDVGYEEDGGAPLCSVKYDGPCETEEQFNTICSEIPLKV